jgi:hypothetical protein
MMAKFINSASIKEETAQSDFYQIIWNYSML